MNAATGSPFVDKDWQGNLGTDFACAAVACLPGQSLGAVANRQSIS
jgi:hypothetical protein